jgi:hypothetical protein
MKKLAAAAVLGLVSWTGAQAQTCGNHPLTVPLLAQGTIAAGTVTVSNDTTTLHVTIATTGAYTISQADVAVGATLAAIPQPGGQGPDPSQFPYRMSFSPATTSHTFDIPLGSTVIGSSLFIAAHAVVGVPCQAQKDAWGAGQLFPGAVACKQGGSGEDDGDDDHAESGGGGDRAATLRGTGHDEHGGGDGCSEQHHGDGAFRRGTWASHGEGDPCGDHHGDGSRALRGSGRGNNSGHDGHDDEGGCGGGSKPCGATYFVYVVNCMVE